MFNPKYLFKKLSINWLNFDPPIIGFIDDVSEKIVEILI